jgi:hypothetical protein
MSHVDDVVLVDYCVGDRLGDPALAGLEEHLFACDACTARATATSALLRNLRAAVSVLPPVVLSEGQLQQLERERVVQRCLVGAFEQRQEKVKREAQIVVTRVSVDLTGVERLDVQLCSRDGAPFSEVYDAPFEPGARFVNIACDAHIAGMNPAFRVRLKGVKNAKPVELADCLLLQDV